MAVAGIKLKLDTTEFASLVRTIGTFFPAKQAAGVLVPIIRKAIAPTRRALKAITPVGPTGNLKNAVASKVVQYAKDGVAVGIVGYRRDGKGPSSSAAGGSVRAGNTRAYHQWLLEFGTDERKFTTAKFRTYSRRSPTAPFVRTRLNQRETVQGRGVVHQVTEKTPTYIASSFNKLGPFKIGRIPRGGERGVQTDPAYPRAFFKKSNQPFAVGPTPAGGVKGIPPVNQAWLQTQAEVAAILQNELSLTLAEAWAALKYRPTGSVSGTDTL
jgi:hypothetical protein